MVNPPWKVAAAHYSGEQWLFLLLFSLISVLAPFSFYFAGLQHLEPTRAIVVSCLEPVFSIIIAAIALGEIMRPLQVAGIVLVLAAIVVVQLPDGGPPSPCRWSSLSSDPEIRAVILSEAKDLCIPLHRLCVLVVREGRDENP